MSKNFAKNGGFPPIKYCKEIKLRQEEVSGKTSKERFFSNAPKQNINIRQLLSDTKKKPIIITDENDIDELEIVTDI